MTDFMLGWDLKPGLLASAWNPLLGSVKDLIDNTAFQLKINISHYGCNWNHKTCICITVRVLKLTAWVEILLISLLSTCLSPSVRKQNLMNRFIFFYLNASCTLMRAWSLNYISNSFSANTDTYSFSTASYLRAQVVYMQTGDWQVSFLYQVSVGVGLSPCVLPRTVNPNSW